MTHTLSRAIGAVEYAGESGGLSMNLTICETLSLEDYVDAIVVFADRP